jgi:hypothetical protein
MSDTLSINIKIDNRIYPLVVSRKDEARYRNAAKKLNEVVATFKVNYPTRICRTSWPWRLFSLFTVRWF